MPTGDGLLVRLTPGAPLPIAAWGALCAAGTAHGNGIIEITQRGNLQFRGLTTESAPAFAAQVAGLELAPRSRVALVTSPLPGMDALELLDVRSIVTDLRRKLLEDDAFAVLGPKVSVLIDGGGELHLDEVGADLRLSAIDACELHLSIAGTARTAVSLGNVAAGDAAPAAVAILRLLAAGGADARARDLVDQSGLAALRAVLADRLLPSRALPARPTVDAFGPRLLRRGARCFGVAAAFGYLHADALQSFVTALADCGVTAITPAPGRLLLALGAEGVRSGDIAVLAARTGFIVNACDPRRRVVACAGAPACASAAWSTRDLGPAVARAAHDWLDGSVTVHLSGCSKGCAHAAPAALTFVGPDRIVIGGRADDTPHGRVSESSLLEALRRLNTARRALPDGVSSAQMFSAWGPARVRELLEGDLPHG
jgi:precorrin-3B synthase